MTLEYKNYLGSVEFDEERQLLWGRVLNTRDVITYEAESVPLLIKEFEKSVDVYLQFCKDLGQEPEKPFSGNIPLRLPPDLHRAIYARAAQAGQSMNTWVKEVLEKAVAATVRSTKQTGTSRRSPSKKPRKPKKNQNVQA
jgi:predicted HicB family RNase H-like nuclease